MIYKNLRREFFKEELSINKALNAVDKLIGKNRVISAIYPNLRYNDEPKLFQYTAIYNSKHQDNLAGGASIDKKKALIKVTGEAIERYCLEIYNKKNFVNASYVELGEKALDPTTVVAFSPTQLKLKTYSQFKFDKKTSFWWVKGFSLLQNTQKFIPAQLVFVPYIFEDEPIIRFPITTGAASGTTLHHAIYRGICEIIERDAFMITYLNRLSRDKINLLETNDQNIKRLDKLFKRYKLELHVIDITTDVPVPTFAAIIIDETGVGPAVSIGLKSSLNPTEAILGAIEEAQHTRPWIRDELAKNPKIPKIKNSAEKITGLVERGLFWSTRDMINYVDFLLNGRTVDIDDVVKITVVSNKSPFENILDLLQIFNFDVFFVEVTTPNVEKVGFRVVKVIIPQLQPLYLEEPLKYLGGDRLYKVPVILGFQKRYSSENQLNQIPHPFL